MKRKPLKLVRWKVIREDPKGKRISCLAKGKYSLVYKKGRVVKAAPNSIGVMCFDTKRNATAWLSGQQDQIEHSNPTIPYGNLPENKLFIAKIAKVRPIGKGWRPGLINCAFSADSIKHVCDLVKKHGLTKVLFGLLWDEPPKGTICYHEVEVLS